MCDWFQSERADMNSGHDCIANECFTVTQRHHIGQQLRFGSRYFDIRPVVREDNSNWCTGHFSDEVGSLFIGCEGQWGDTLVYQIQDFFADPNHRRELVILNFSHCAKRLGVAHAEFKNCSQDEEQKVVKGIQDKLGSLLVKCDGCALTDMTLDEILKHGNIIIRGSGLNDTANGVFNLGIDDNFSNSDDLNSMRNNQLDKLRQHRSSDNLFLLSWTLTVQATNPQCVLELADEANSKLMGALVSWYQNGDITESQFPNIVFVDAFDIFVTEAAIYLNSLVEPVALWASHTEGHPGAYYSMQHDGNLVIYEKEAAPIWASGTHGHPGTKLVMQEDGNLVILPKELESHVIQ